MEQHERYLALRGQVQEKYELLKPHLRESDLSTFWQSGIEKARTVVLPYPDFDFMGKPGLRGRMGTHPRKSVVMKAWLEKNFDRRTTKKGLVVDDFGCMPLDSFLGYDVSDDVIKFLYYAAVFTKISRVPIKSVTSVIEWGGGYGGQAKIFKRMGHPNLTYTIADIPPVCVLQWLYLSVLFGEDAVNLISEPGAQVVKGKINILPSPLLFQLPRDYPDLFISTNALNECPADLVRAVVENREWFGATHILLRLGSGHVMDESSPTGYYDLIAAAGSFGVERNPLRNPEEFKVIVRSR